MSTGQPQKPSAVKTTLDQFKDLVEIRLAESERLLADGMFDGAYYLAGYVVEFALKVVILRNLASSGTHPAKPETDRYYGHDLGHLQVLANLKDAEEEEDDQSVEVAWQVVKRWTEQSRYETGRTENDARNLVDAVKVVLPSIRRNWP